MRAFAIALIALAGAPQALAQGEAWASSMRSPSASFGHAARTTLGSSFMRSIAGVEQRPFIVKPLCPPGTRAARPDGSMGCIEGDPWSRDAFRAVVPLLVDGALDCTATLISDAKAITAAHCVVEFSGPGAPSIVVRSRLQLVLPNGARVHPSQDPAVPRQMLQPCTLPELKCPDFAYDVAVIAVDAQAALQDVGFARLLRLMAPADLAITFAGYGFTTIVDMAPGELLIGSQNVHFTVNDGPLRWVYDFESDRLSTICKGDSGGPIFSGRPRRVGDPLTLVGVISNFAPSAASPDPLTPDTSLCRKATASAVNLAAPGVASALCGLLGADPYCAP